MLKHNDLFRPISLLVFQQSIFLLGSDNFCSVIFLNSSNTRGYLFKVDFPNIKGKFEITSLVNLIG